jgi:endonuclease G
MTRKDEFAALVASTAADRAKVRDLVAAGKWQLAEPDKARLAGYIARTAKAKSLKGAEAVQGPTVDFQPVSFLAQGNRIQRAVAYVEVMTAGASCTGSGFLISPDLFITNQHVISDINAARGAQIVFDRQADITGRPLSPTTFLLDPDRCAIFSPVDQLDYAVIAVGERTAGAAMLVDLGFCPLLNRTDKHALGINVNIIQHPNGAPKLIAIRNNLLTAETPDALLYETDTEEGSSGSLVCNDLWEAIALHHYGQPFLAEREAEGQTLPQAVNEGIRISSIWKNLSSRLAELSGEAASLMTKALAYDSTTPVATGERQLGPPHPVAHAPESTPLGDATKRATAQSRPLPHASESDSLGEQTTSTMADRRFPPASESAPLGEPQMPVEQELKFTIPLEISVRVGSVATSAIAPQIKADSIPALQAKALVRGAESVRIDADYSNRNGYDADFIPGLHVPMPQPNADLTKQIGGLSGNVPNAGSGLLIYEHFSLIMNKSKRVAMFTATNIDGETYLNVDRGTGEVKGAEGDTWFKEPRISASFYLGQDFYSSWSHIFDRGHLTRRSDPTWGTPAEAERANADTFHLTNCSPQHFLFNESSKYWQGVELYVLEQGTLAQESRKRLCVFQGPTYDDAIDQMADDVQVPSSFYKIVVWKGQAGIKSVGLVVDQLQLLSITRHGVKVGSDTTVQVKQWRAKISDIAAKTGLIFDPVIVDNDTISQPGQPAVGEARTLIRSFADIKL